MSNSTSYTQISAEFTPNLFHTFCLIKNKTKPKLKEIITMFTKNLVDLTKSVIQIHELLNNPKYKELQIYDQTFYELEAWHNELISIGLSQRRNISRSMSELKEIMANIKNINPFFEELDNITKPIRQNWKPELCANTGQCLREILLDLVLIVDPKIKGEIYSNTEDFDMIHRRISEMSDKSKGYLNFEYNNNNGIVNRTQSTLGKSRSMSALSQNIFEQIIPEEDVIYEETPRNPNMKKEKQGIKKYLARSKEGDDFSYLSYTPSGSFIQNLTYCKNSELEIKNKNAPNQRKADETSLNIRKNNSQRVIGSDILHQNIKALKSFNTQSEPSFNIKLTRKSLSRSNSKNKSSSKKLQNPSELFKDFDLPLKDDNSDRVVISYEDPNLNLNKPEVLIKQCSEKLNFGDPNSGITKTMDSKTSFAFSNQTFFNQKPLHHQIYSNELKHFHGHINSKNTEKNIKYENNENARFSQIQNSKQNMIQINFNSKDTFGKPRTGQNSKENTQRNIEEGSIDITLDDLCISKREQSVGLKVSQSPKIEIIDESLSRNLLLDSETKEAILGESLQGNYNSYLKEVENYKNILEEISKHQQESRLNSIQIEEQGKGIFKSSPGKVVCAETEISSSKQSINSLFKVKLNENSQELSKKIIKTTRDRGENIQTNRSQYLESNTSRIPIVIDNGGSIFDNTPKRGNMTPKDKENIKHSPNSAQYTVQSYRFENKVIQNSSRRVISNKELEKIETSNLNSHHTSTTVFGESCSPKPKKEGEIYETEDYSDYENYDSRLKNIPQKVDSNTPVRYSSNKYTTNDSMEKKRALVKKSNFDMKKFLNGRDSEKIHINFDGVQKLALSNDGDYILFGGDGLHVLDMSDNNFRMVRYDRNFSKFYFLIFF